MNAMLLVAKQRPKRVLLVDDDHGIIEAMVEGLRRKGYQVKSYTDPSIALTEFRPRSYDVAVLDVRMDGMDGLELHRRLKAMDPRLAVFFLSAYSDSIKGKPNGVPFLQKPISLAELSKALEET